MRRKCGKGKCGDRAVRPEQRRYSVFRNVGYCIFSTAGCCRPLLVWCALAVAGKAGLSVLSVYLPKAVLEAISAEGSPRGVIAAIFTVAGGIALLSGADTFLTKYIYQQKYRMNSFYLGQVAAKGLTTDYRNQEDEEFRLLQAEACSCCSGNDSPLSNIYEVLIGLFSGVLGLAAFWAILARIGGGLVLFLVAAAGAGYFLNRRALHWAQENNREKTGYRQRMEYISAAAGNIRFAKDIRLYHMAGWFSEIYRQNMQGLAGWYRRLAKKLFGAAAGEGALGFLSEGAAGFYLLCLAWGNRISAADFILYFGAVTGFSSWLGDAFSQVAALNRMNLRINSFRSYLQYPERYLREGGLSVPAGRFPKEIELKNVSYRYAQSGQAALQDINLKVSPGEHLAVVGLNGAGKTTLVKLICGLVDPTGGQVLYDGIDIREYDRREFYRLFSAVNQRYSILPVTVEEIVAEAPAEKADPARVERCLRAAGLWEKISRLPAGIKTPFGKKVHDSGIELSGGEIQKLLLARALYRAAPILLLDEPTAALDPIAESRLYESYHQMGEGKTGIFISHRLASASFCDRILLLEGGRICEEGTHESLLRRGGEYARLFAVQAKYYREGPQGREAEK